MLLLQGSPLPWLLPPPPPPIPYSFLQYAILEFLQISSTLCHLSPVLLEFILPILTSATPPPPPNLLFSGSFSVSVGHIPYSDPKSLEVVIILCTFCMMQLCEGLCNVMAQIGCYFTTKFRTKK